MNVVTMSGEIKFQGDVGPRGPKGEKGDTYEVTQEDLEVIAEQITSIANSEFNQNSKLRTDEFNANALDKTTEFDKNAVTKTNDFNSNVTSKTNEFNSNANSTKNAYNANATEKMGNYDTNARNKLNQYNQNDEEKLEDYNANATTKITAYNENAETQLTTFNNNATSKTNTFNNNVTTKTNTFNTNASNKTTSFNENSTQKTNDYNANTEEKTNAFNANYEEKLNLFNSDTSIERITTLETQVGKLEQKVDQAEAILPTQVASGENVYIENAQKYPLMSLAGEGKSVQEVEPTPENPQEIKTINEASYRGTRKNILKKYSNSGSKTISGVTITQNEDGTFTFNGTCTNKFWLEYIFDFKNGTSSQDYYSFLLDSSKEYTHSLTLLYGSITGAFNSTLGLDINDGEKSKSAEINKPGIFTGAEGISRGYFWVATNSTFNNAVIGAQLEKGNVATPFEPYKESTVAIDIQGNELASVGTVSDKLLIDRKGNVVIEKNMPKVVFDGSDDENWIATANANGYRYRIDINNIKINSSTQAKPKLIASHFQTVTPADTWNSVTGITVSETTNRIYIYTDFTNTVADFKAWLSEHPVTVYYELATPELISLGTIENPEIFKGVNNIIVETNLGNMNIEVEYVEDLQARIEKVEQAIVSLANV